VAGFVGLALLVFDPNLLAHGAVVGTDVGITVFMFATVYAFYRYCKDPSIKRLLLTGVAFGLALAAKHTGILVFPILLLLAICELVLASQEVRKPQALRLVSALVGIGVIGVAILWAFYGFRYQARPDGLAMNGSLADNIAHISRPREAWGMTQIARFHLLPESYLIGLADVRNMSDFYQSFALGKTYPHGVWFYFPLAFVIKSTTAFLLLFAIAIFAIATRKFTYWREILYLTVPACFHFFIAMISRMNIGVRHILPVYAFVAVLIGGGVWALMQKQRAWIYVTCALLAYQAFTAIRAYPAYIPYANEFWGGPSQTWHLLSDSNADWGQQLKSTKRYLDKNNIHDCWMIYFAEGVVDASYYGVSCKQLPTMDSAWMDEDLVAPPEIDGTLLISAGDLSGFEFGPGKLNLYEQFKTIKPVAAIDHGIYVYQGHFKIPQAAAFSHWRRIGGLMDAKQFDQALSEAKQAAALDPESAQIQLALGRAYDALGRKEEARPAYERAVNLAETIEPEFQQGTAQGARSQLANLETLQAGAR
jgi:tetratricopeptide (TPR) repeat protein